MAKMLIKKFTLLRNGVRYTAGAVVDLPDDEAAALAKDSPKEFEVIDMPVVEEAIAKEQAAPAAGAASVPEDTPEFNLDKLNVAQLKKFAKDNGIDVGGATKKQELLDAIADAGEKAEQEGLPEIDAEALVK